MRGKLDHLEEQRRRKPEPLPDPPLPDKIRFIVEKNGVQHTVEIDKKHAEANVPWPMPVLLLMMHGGKMTITDKT